MTDIENTNLLIEIILRGKQLSGTHRKDELLKLHAQNLDELIEEFAKLNPQAKTMIRQLKDKKTTPIGINYLLRAYNPEWSKSLIRTSFRHAYIVTSNRGAYRQMR